MPLGQRLRIATDERRQIEMGELDRGRLAGAVARQHVVVGAFIGCPVERAFLDQELDPGLVAVDGEQGMVKVEQRQYVAAHDRSARIARCARSGSQLRTRWREWRAA